MKLCERYRNSICFTYNTILKYMHSISYPHRLSRIWLCCGCVRFFSDSYIVCYCSPPRIDIGGGRGAGCGPTTREYGAIVAQTSKGNANAFLLRLCACAEASTVVVGPGQINVQFIPTITAEAIAFRGYGFATNPRRLKDRKRKNEREKGLFMWFCVGFSMYCVFCSHTYYGRSRLYWLFE